MTVVSPVAAAATSGTSGAYSASPTRSAAPFAGSGHDHFAGSSASRKGSASNLGLITGALTCCAIVPFVIGAVVLGGLTLAARRAFKGISHLHVPQHA
jgi:hypothetical protein